MLQNVQNCFILVDISDFIELISLNEPVIMNLLNVLTYASYSNSSIFITVLLQYFGKGMRDSLERDTECKQALSKLSE